MTAWDRMLGLLGLQRTTIAAGLASLPADVAAQGQQVTPQRWGANSTSTTNRVGSLTAARVLSALSAADQGRPATWVELLDQVEERNSHLVSVLGTRKRSVVTLPYAIEPADDTDQARVIADAATMAMRQMRRRTRSLLELLDAISKGYAAAEIVWEVRDGLRVPAELRRRPQAWLVPDPDREDRWLVLTDEEPMGAPLWPYHWVVHTSAAKAGGPIQAGLGRTSVWWHLYSMYAIQDWATYAERYGAPIRIGEYDPAFPDDRDRLEEAVQKLGIDAYAVVPKGTGIRFEGDNSSRGPDVYERLVERANREISKAVLGQTLTTEEGQNGTQALGQVHNSVRADLRDSDADELALTLTEQVLRPFVELNWGSTVADRLTPTWVWDTRPPQDRKADADVQEARGRVFAAARSLGIPIPLAQAREELGVRELGADEAALPPIAAPADVVAPAAIAGPAAAPVAATDPASAPPVPADVDTATELQAFCDKLTAAGVTRCEHGSVNRCRICGIERVRDFKLDAAGAPQWIVKWRPLVVAASSRGCGCDVHAVARSGDVAAAAVGEVTIRPTDQLDESLGAYRNQVGRAWAALVGLLRTELGDVDAQELRAAVPRIVAQMDLGVYVEPLAEAMLSAQALGILQARAADSAPVRLPAGSPTSPAWPAALELAPEVWAQRIARARTRAEEAIRYALLGTLKRFVAAMEAGESADDALPGEEVHPAKAAAVVEGATVGAWGEGRWEGVDKTDAGRPYLRYHTMQDNRVRPAHQAMEGRVYPADHPIWQVWRPPNGFGCRCWLTAHTAAEVEAAGWDVMDSYPAIREGKQAGKPAVPDPGWTSSREAPPHDVSAFPEDWVAAVDAQVEKHRVAMERRAGGEA